MHTIATRKISIITIQQGRWSIHQKSGTAIYGSHINKINDSGIGHAEPGTYLARRDPGSKVALAGVGRVTGGLTLTRGCCVREFFLVPDLDRAAAGFDVTMRRS